MSEGAYNSEIKQARIVAGGILRKRQWDTGHVQYELGRETASGLRWSMVFSKDEIKPCRQRD